MLVLYNKTETSAVKMSISFSDLTRPSFSKKWKGLSDYFFFSYFEKEKSSPNGLKVLKIVDTIKFI